jgi:hypothetical protein
LFGLIPSSGDCHYTVFSSEAVAVAAFASASRADAAASDDPADRHAGASAASEAGQLTSLALLSSLSPERDMPRGLRLSAWAGLVAIWFAVFPVTAQTMFKCKDAGNRITYSNIPCDKQGLQEAGPVADRTTTMPLGPAPQAPQAPAKAGKPPPPPPDSAPEKPTK